MRYCLAYAPFFTPPLGFLSLRRPEKNPHPGLPARGLPAPHLRPPTLSPRGPAEQRHRQLQPRRGGGGGAARRYLRPRSPRTHAPLPHASLAPALTGQHAPRTPTLAPRHPPLPPFPAPSGPAPQAPAPRAAGAQIPAGCRRSLLSSPPSCLPAAASAHPPTAPWPPGSSSVTRGRRGPGSPGWAATGRGRWSRWGGGGSRGLPSPRPRNGRRAGGPEPPSRGVLPRCRGFSQTGRPRKAGGGPVPLVPERGRRFRTGSSRALKRGAHGVGASFPPGWVYLGYGPSGSAAAAAVKKRGLNSRGGGKRSGNNGEGVPRVLCPEAGAPVGVSPGGGVGVGGRLLPCGGGETRGPRSFSPPLPNHLTSERTGELQNLRRLRSLNPVV